MHFLLESTQGGVAGDGVGGGERGRCARVSGGLCGGGAGVWGYGGGEGCPVGLEGVRNPVRGVQNAEDSFAAPDCDVSAVQHTSLGLGTQLSVRLPRKRTSPASISRTRSAS